MKVKLISGVDKDITDWEDEINTAIIKIELNGHKVTSVAWQIDFASIAYATQDDLQEGMIAKKGLANELIGDTLGSVLGRK